MIISSHSIFSEYWPIDAVVELHRNVANFVYFSKIGNQDIVIRLTPTSQRTLEEIQAEIQWMNDLQGHFIFGPKFIRSTKNNFVEKIKIDTNEYFIVVMDKIQGTRIGDDPGQIPLSNDLVIAWAKVLAKHHQMSKNNPKLYLRADWDTDSTFVKALTAINESTPEAASQFKSLIKILKNKSKQSQLCLIHGDLHTGNFFVQQDKIVVFDYDDCCYHWLEYDLTVCLIAIFKMWDLDENTLLKNSYIILFLKTYFSIVPKPLNFKEDILLFIQYRLLLVHFWMIAIRKERALSPQLESAFTVAIAEDLHIAMNPLLFSFITNSN